MRPIDSGRSLIQIITIFCPDLRVCIYDIFTSDP